MTREQQPRKSNSQVRYRAVRRDGVGVTGVTFATAADVAKRMFDAGFRSATITDSCGEEVGGISHRADDGVLDWWGAR